MLKAKGNTLKRRERADLCQGIPCSNQARGPKGSYVST